MNKADKERVSEFFDCVNGRGEIDEAKHVIESMFGVKIDMLVEDEELSVDKAIEAVGKNWSLEDSVYKLIMDSVQGSTDNQFVYDYAEEYGEPGYHEEGLVLLGNWNMTGNCFFELLENMGYNPEWHDEWIIASDGKAYRTQASSVWWRPSWFYLDGEIIPIKGNEHDYYENASNTEKVAMLVGDPESFGWVPFGRPFTEELDFKYKDVQNIIDVITKTWQVTEYLLVECENKYDDPDCINGIKIYVKQDEWSAPTPYEIKKKGPLTSHVADNAIEIWATKVKANMVEPFRIRAYSVPMCEDSGIRVTRVDVDEETDIVFVPTDGTADLYDSDSAQKKANFMTDSEDIYIYAKDDGDDVELSIDVLSDMTKYMKISIPKK